MQALAKSTRRPHKDFSCCSGCSLCLLVCPVWRRTHDFALTPLGRAKALLFGAGAADIAVSVQSCTLCAACEPVCPEEIPLIEMTLALRRRLLEPGMAQYLSERMQLQAARPRAPLAAAAAVLLPGPGLRRRAATLARAAALLGGARLAIAEDDGADIALALEAGVPVPAQRLERFLQPLRGYRKIICADGLLLRQAKRWLPGSAITSLGAALSGLAAVRRDLGPGDLYVIEPRAYHEDYPRLVGHYDALRAERGCVLNLDLQRIALPATARSLAQRLGREPVDDSVQLDWILQGRAPTRIVVESLEDGAAFSQRGRLPVVHLADLADDAAS
jgi:ferredoxin